MKNRIKLPDVLLLLTALLWGTGFVATPLALHTGLDTRQLLAARFTVAALCMGVIRLLRRGARVSRPRASLLYGFGAGLLLFSAFWFQTAALAYTTPSNNAFLTGTNVLMVPFLVWALKRKPPKPRFFIAAAGCLAGVFVLSFQAGSALTFNLGDGMTLVCAFFYALHIVFIGQAVRHVDVPTLTFLQFAVAALLSLVSLRVLPITAAPRWADALPFVLYLGLFCTCAGFGMQSYAQQHTSPAKVGVLLCCEAVFGCLFSVLAGLEPFSPRMVLGGGLIVLSVAFVEAGNLDSKALLRKRGRNYEEEES